MKYNVQFTNQFKKDLKLASEPMGSHHLLSCSMAAQPAVRSELTRKL